MRYLLISALVFLGCSSADHSVEYQAVAMSDSVMMDAGAEAMIKPYRDSLELTMTRVLVQNPTELTRGIPESTLGNLVADLLLERAQVELGDSILPDFCLVNIGGLRVDLPKGGITVRKVFELMPFENEIDIIKLSPEKMHEMFEYLKMKGGQPISGMNLEIEAESFNCKINNESFDTERSYYVVTSDYLADGGDRMDFFNEPEARIKTGVSIRDAIIDHFNTLGLAGKSLESKLDGRLTIK
jgi:2',3'-cyclic-nucleotide 2'-phosphodiesterase (5'-nucleotidase family)